MSVSILAGDIRDRLSEIPDGSVDVIVTDPPYGETALAWDKWVTGWPALVRRVLKPSGSMWVFGSTRMFMTRSNEFSAWHIAQDVVWEKHNGSGFMSDRFRRVHEGAVQF
jgi:site-specific DNA-methyltransferase (adenine-specific)